jgi:hypothetical protein
VDVQVPAQYASMPLLKGRATIELTVKYIDNPRVKEETLTIVVDGLNAPVTAGNFVDLVERKFYNGLKIDRADGFVVQVSVDLPRQKRISNRARKSQLRLKRRTKQPTLFCG